MIDRFKKWVKDSSDKLSPSGEYHCDGAVVKGRKTSVFLVTSFVVSTFMAVIPVLTGDTATYDCESDGGDSGEEFCVVSSENNPAIYLFLAFYQYPWVVAAYFKTGLWMNASGINAKINALYGSWFQETGGICLWDRKDWASFLDYLGVVGGTLAFLTLYVQTICLCDGEKNYGYTLSFVAIAALTGLSSILGYGILLGWAAPTDSKLRLKRLTKFYFVSETCAAGAVYVNTYGSGGVFFLLVPILGFIESFGVFECVSGDSGCLLC